MEFTWGLEVEQRKGCIIWMVTEMIVLAIEIIEVQQTSLGQQGDYEVSVRALTGVVAAYPFQI